MQFIADICKTMISAGYISVNDLYVLSEKAVIKRILTCNDINIVEAFKKFQTVGKVYTSNEFIEGKYCVKVNPKARYINPLVLNKGRIYDISNLAREKIDNYLSLKKDNITYFDFEFNCSYNDEVKKYKRV